MNSPAPSSTAAASPVLDVVQVRSQFPILTTQVHGHPLAYLDNAASTQKPQAVIDAELNYYRAQNANIHRAVHQLSQVATHLYEAGRKTVARFINAPDPAAVIFTRGTTESINLVASTWGLANLRAGDQIIVSHLEHHSNIVPWQMLCQRTGAQLRVIPVTDAGELDMEAYRGLLTDRTRLVAVNHVSNALGTINPVDEIIRLAHAAGARVLIDAAQWVAHGRTDVQALGADFLAFSGHKLYGPTGIGVLYGKRDLLEAMPPYQGGGDMIASVSFEGTTYAELPNKFEAGTPNIAGVVGLAAAIDYVQSLGLDRIAQHEHDLLVLATDLLSQIPGLRLIGTASHKAAVVSFVVDDPPMATLDIGTQLDLTGIAVRTGHHCCEPLMDRFGVASTARASFGLYNTAEEVVRLAESLGRIVSQARDKKTVATAAEAPAPPPGADASQTPAYPAAEADSPEQVAEDLAALFDFLPDWQTRYQQIIEFGEKLPLMPQTLKTPENFVKGCQSTVHIAARIKPHTRDVVEFLADSDADIVRGLIALLQKLYSGQSAAAILRFDAQQFFSQLGLDDNLSMTRRNGLASMIQRIRRIAERV